MKNQKIRLYGIDTPELRGEEKEAGLEAKAALMKWLPIGSEFELKTWKDSKGKYGRWLGTIFVYDVANTPQMVISMKNWLRMDMRKEIYTIKSLMIVRESLLEFERSRDIKRSLEIGQLAKPMKERSREFNAQDRQKAIDFLESTGIIKLAEMSPIQEKNQTIKLVLNHPYYHEIKTWNHNSAKNERISIEKGEMFYFIQGGYLRKWPSHADRPQVIYRDYYATYLELAEMLLPVAQKDIIKSDKLKEILYKDQI